MTTLVTNAARLNPIGVELRATLVLAVPLIFTQLAQISILTTDVLMMGWLGSAALAAGALGANVVFMQVMFGFGIVMATAPMMAQALGAKRHSLREVRRSFRQGAWASIAIGLGIGAIVMTSESLLRALGQDPAISAQAASYARALIPGILPLLLFTGLRQFTAALERPRPALVVQLAMLVFNAGANYVLIFGKLGFPALGLIGAGLATSITNWLGFVALLVWVMRDRRMRRYHLLGRFWRADWPRLAQIFRLGLPISIAFVLEVGLFSGAVYTMGIIGTAELAAHQIAIQVAATTFMIPLGLAQAATVRVGLHAGAGDAVAVRRAGWTALVLATGFMATMAVTIALARHPILGLFLDVTDPGNQRSIAIGATFLIIAGVFQIFDGGQCVALGALRGLKDTRVPMLITALGYWAIGFPVGLILAFPLALGGVGVWWGLALGLMVVAVLTIWRFARCVQLGLLDGAR